MINLNNELQRHQHQQQQQQQAMMTMISGNTNELQQQQQQHYINPYHYATSARQLQSQQQQQLAVSNMHAPAGINRPLCRCRVIYLGSSVPHKTKNGLHGIQEPLKSLYPDERFQQQQQQATDDDRKLKSQANIENNKKQYNTIDISHLSSSLGIDSWLSVWTNGILLENVDEFGREIKRFFSIESLHYCAAVRFFDTRSLESVGTGNNNNNNNNIQSAATNGTSKSESVPSKGGLTLVDQNNNNITEQEAAVDQEKLISDGVVKTINDGGSGQQTGSGRNESSVEGCKPAALNGNANDSIMVDPKSTIKFLPLDAPLFQCPGMLDTKHPPVFSAILRRTSGIKVLECHSFICRRDAAANALVRCCTHAYADLVTSRQRQALGLALAQPTVPHGAYYAGPSQASSASHHYRPNKTTLHNGYNTTRSRKSNSTVKSMPASHDRWQRSMGRKSRRDQQQQQIGASDDDETSIERRAFQPLLNNTGNRQQDLDSSCDETHYAIISRTTTTTTSNNQPPQQARSQSGQKAQQSSRAEQQVTGQTKRKGSSRSLFKNFQPPEGVAYPSRQESDHHHHLQSHSAEQLINESRAGGSIGSRVSRASTGSGRNKRRHSKSMQELTQGGSYFLNENKPTTNKALPKRKGSLGASSMTSASLRNSSSWHEILQVNQPISSGPRASSNKRDKSMATQQQHQHHQNEYEELTETQRQRDQSPEAEVNRALRSAMNRLNRVQHTGSHTMKPVTRSRPQLIETNQHQTSNIYQAPNGTAAALNQYMVPNGVHHPHPNAQMTNPGALYGQPMLYQQQASHQLTMHGPNPGLYMIPPANARLLAGHPAAGLYDTPMMHHPQSYPMGIPLAMGNPYAPNPYALPMMFPGGGHLQQAMMRLPPGSSATLSYHKHHQQRRKSHLIGSTKESKQLQQLGHGKPAQEQRALDIAAQFRCLSPPANLLGPSYLAFHQRHQQEQALLNPIAVPPPPPIPISPPTNDLRLDSSSSVGSRRRSRQLSQSDRASIASCSIRDHPLPVPVQDLPIITSPPAFLLPARSQSQVIDYSSVAVALENTKLTSSPGGGQQSAEHRAPKQRLSWFKRLSLTLSTGSASSAPDSSALHSISQDPGAKRETNNMNNPSIQSQLIGMETTRVGGAVDKDARGKTKSVSSSKKSKEKPAKSSEKRSTFGISFGRSHKSSAAKNQASSAPSAKSHSANKLENDDSIQRQQQQQPSSDLAPAAQLDKAIEEPRYATRQCEVQSPIEQPVHSDSCSLIACNDGEAGAGPGTEHDAEKPTAQHQFDAARCPEPEEQAAGVIV